MIITINLSNNKSISLPYEKAKSILESPDQLVMVYDGDKWNGKTINKAHIVNTSVDNEASKFEEMPENNFPKLKAQDENERVGSIKNTLDEKRAELKAKGII